MTQAPVTPVDTPTLAGATTDQVMFDLLRRANEALVEVDYEEATRLFQAVLAYRPGDGLILQVLGEIALAQDNWAAAREYELQALGAPMPHSVFIRACAILCCATWMRDGEAGVQPAYEMLRDKLKHALDTAGEKLPTAEMNLGISAAMCAGDHETAHKYFLRRFAGMVPPDVQTRISPATTLRAWCKANGARFQELDPVKRITSQGLPPGHGEWDFETDGVNFAVIPGGEMHSGMDFVFTPAGEIIEDSGHVIGDTGTAWYPRVHARPTSLMLHLWSDDVTEIDEPALFMSCSQGFHVGHWLVDFLPRLRALALRPDLKIALPTETPRKLRDFLIPFGIDDSRIINCDLNRRYRFRELAVVQTGSEHRPEPNNVCFVTDGLRTRPRPEGPPLRLFLERDMKNRAVANQAEFYGELERLGFDRMNLAAMSVAEQRAALARAEAVITTYGSDLLAFYMMNEGAALIELNWNPAALDARVQAKASMVGVMYYLVQCASADSSQHRYYKKDSDFTVDLPALRETLRTAGIAIPADP